MIDWIRTYYGSTLFPIGKQLNFHLNFTSEISLLAVLQARVF